MKLIPSSLAPRIMRWFNKAVVELGKADHPIIIAVYPGVRAEDPTEFLPIPVSEYRRETTALMLRDVVDTRGIAALFGKYANDGRVNAQLYFAEGSVFELSRGLWDANSVEVNGFEQLASPLVKAVVV